jgi:hypothetical protein
MSRSIWGDDGQIAIEATIMADRRGILKCLRTWLAGALFLFASPTLAFQIVEPAEGSRLKSGQMVTAKVDLGKDLGVIKVRYYWYSEHGETLVEQEESEKSTVPSSARIADEKYFQREGAGGGAIVAVASLVSTTQQEPPFGGPLQVPREAIGTMRLLAVGEISRGRLGTHSVFDEILVSVQPEAELTAIEFETEKPLSLGRPGQAATYGQVDSMGKIFDLPVVGQFSDGVVRLISSPSSGTSYRSSNEKVIKIIPDLGLLQVVGNGRTTLTVSNRGQQETLDIIVDVGDEPNEPPIADAGASRTVKAGTRVELNGLKSRDPEGEALYYAWSQVRGSKVPLLDLNMPKASFVAPQVSEPRAYRFKLRVTDKLGADSLPDYVDITIEP